MRIEMLLLHLPFQLTRNLPLDANCEHKRSEPKWWIGKMETVDWKEGSGEFEEEPVGKDNWSIMAISGIIRPL